jgi:hypothetical protein
MSFAELTNRYFNRLMYVVFIVGFVGAILWFTQSVWVGSLREFTSLRWVAGYLLLGVFHCVKDHRTSWQNMRAYAPVL